MSLRDKIKKELKKLPICCICLAYQILKCVEPSPELSMGVRFRRYSHVIMG